MKVINYYTRNKKFLIICGGALALLSFFLSFFGVNDDHIYYYYYIICYFLLISVVSINFNKKKMVVSVTIISILHLIYAFNFYPEINSSIYIGSIFYNVFIVSTFYLTGFVMNYYKESNEAIVNAKVNEINKIKKELKNVKNTKHEEKTIANEIVLEKRLNRLNSYVQIEDEIIKAIITKRSEFDVFFASLLQSRLKTGVGILYRYSSSGVWEQIHKLGTGETHLNEQKIDQFLNSIVEEGVPISNRSEVCYKYKLELDVENGIIGIPVFVEGAIRSIVVLEDFRDNNIEDDEKFCLRLCVSLGVSR